jgi:hypothetical protein
MLRSRLVQHIVLLQYFVVVYYCNQRDHMSQMHEWHVLMCGMQHMYHACISCGLVSCIGFCVATACGMTGRCGLAPRSAGGPDLQEGEAAQHLRLPRGGCVPARLGQGGSVRDGALRRGHPHDVHRGVSGEPRGTRRRGACSTQQRWLCTPWRLRRAVSGGVGTLAVWVAVRRGGCCMVSALGGQAACRRLPAMACGLRSWEGR